MPPAPASNGCSQQTRPAPKWAAPILPLPKSHNHCAEPLVDGWPTMKRAANSGSARRLSVRHVPVLRFSCRQGTPVPNNLRQDAICEGSVISWCGRCRHDHHDAWVGGRSLVAACHDDAIDDAGAATELQSLSFRRRSCPAW
jgi:hypothetical protein